MISCLSAKPVRAEHAHCRAAVPSRCSLPEHEAYLMPKSRKAKRAITPPPIMASAVPQPPAEISAALTYDDGMLRKLHTMEEVRQLLAGEDVSVPGVCVAGDQSAGKR